MSEWGRNSKSMEWKQVVAREKTKIQNENNARKEEGKMVLEEGGANM